MAATALNRCVRSLVARDFIGKQFYQLHNHDVRDRIMYRFDNLLLLLAGALDALARIARRPYRNQVAAAGFQRARWNFVRELRTVAPSLHVVATSQRAQDMLRLLFELRNTIHGAGLRSTSPMHLNDNQVDESYVAAYPRYATSFMETVERHGGAAWWGVSRPLGGVWIEPYAIRLLDARFRTVNEMAIAMELPALDPSIAGPVATTYQAALDDSPSDAATGRRLAIFG